MSDNTPGERTPVLFDTDIGTDIDDLIALIYLLAEPRCELVGITTVTGEPQRRASLADAVCRAMGRNDVPIHSGSPTPILMEQHQKRCEQAEVLPRWPHRSDFPAATAVAFMQRMIRERPGEITLLSVGPMTNVGLLFALDPEIPHLIKGLVQMAGVFSGRRTEWNAFGDAHAAAIVYRAHARNHLSVGLDVTEKCRLSADEARSRLRGGPFDLALEAAEVWFRRYPVITFHDPLAAALIFEPEICTYRRGHVEADLKSEKHFGMTHWQDGGDDAPHTIAVEVDADRFFARYFDVVERAVRRL